MLRLKNPTNIGTLTKLHYAYHFIYIYIYIYTSHLILIIFIQLTTRLYDIIFNKLNFSLT